MDSFSIAFLVFAWMTDRQTARVYVCVCKRETDRQTDRERRLGWPSWSICNSLYWYTSMQKTRTLHFDNWPTVEKLPGLLCHEIHILCFAVCLWGFSYWVFFFFFWGGGGREEEVFVCCFCLGGGVCRGLVVYWGRGGGVYPLCMFVFFCFVI